MSFADIMSQRFMWLEDVLGAIATAIGLGITDYVCSRNGLRASPILGLLSY